MKSPSQSQDALLNDAVMTSLQLPVNDPDFDIEAELPPLDQAIPKDRFKKLKPKDKKRQEVINGDRHQPISLQQESP